MNILLYTLRSIAVTITDPYLFVYLIILGVVLYKKNKKTALMQKMIIGESIDSPFELTISQIAIGIIAGTVVSIILSYLGVIFYENSGIELLFLTSILLMFWNPRFICFSYSGAILGLVSIGASIISKALGYDSLNIFEIDIVSLMTTVAVFHFVEGVLVMIDGKKGSIPVFTNRDGKIIGGFAMQRYWVLPIAIFLLLNNKSVADFGGTVPMPQWWPIINTSIPANILETAVVSLMSFYGVIGYSTVTFTKNKSEKVLTSGAYIIAYSAVLFALAQLAYINIYFKLLVLIFAPLAHEIMLIVQRQKELKGKPKYVSDNGIIVLDVAPESPASSMNIKSGDIILEVNNKVIENEQDIFDNINQSYNYIGFKIKKINGKFEEISYNKKIKDKKLGMVFVPKNIPEDSTVMKVNNTKFTDVLDKVKKRNKDNGDE